MSMALIGIIGVVVLVFLFFALRVPIAFAMMLVGVVGYAVLVNPASGLGLLAGCLTSLRLPTT